METDVPINIDKNVENSENQSKNSYENEDELKISNCNQQQYNSVYPLSSNIVSFEHILAPLSSSTPSSEILKVIYRISEEKISSLLIIS